nr:AAA family ATPase [Parablautia muri]
MISPSRLWIRSDWYPFIEGGGAIPSVLFDSTGTKKIAALASYIIEGIEQGRILVVDELDSSIHFKLTRAIVAMFNNELNTDAQMIFTVHDINLMDCKKMFRKEQIWFVHKDDTGIYVYSRHIPRSEAGFLLLCPKKACRPYSFMKPPALISCTFKTPDPVPFLSSASCFVDTLPVVPGFKPAPTAGADTFFFTGY